jgi:hypothetical protein
MKNTRIELLFLALGAASILLVLRCAFAQTAAAPAGNWQSPGHVTYTNAFLVGDEFYLNVDVAKDGSFRGVWGQYFCTQSIGAYGVAIISCSLVGKDPVSGKFGPGNQGFINLEKLGRSDFTWKTANADELALDLPQYWRGESEAILYRARLTRDGKARKPAGTSTPKDEGPPLSAVALYREFKTNENAALKRYVGTTPILEGRRGTLIETTDGGAAIHVPDGFTSRALVLSFAELKQVQGIEENAKFRFRCTVRHFDYQYVYMDNCAIVNE